LRVRALQCLARREYSRAELRVRLLRYATENTDSGQNANLDALLDDLTARGWLSDERAATQLLHARSNRFGALRIVQELRMKGIAEHLIDNVLPELHETELGRARIVWLKKFGALPLDVREKARQMRFMQSRGFGLDVILEVLRLDQAES